MADSTHRPPRRAILALACATVLLGALSLAASTAQADGDPASDVLATQAVSLPQDGAIPAAEQSRLAELVGAAARAGYPLRVAVIATRADLGSVTALWRQPANYARFLGQELSQVFSGTLLVVMPNGYGVTRVRPRSAPGPGGPPALRGLSAPGAGGALGAAAVTAVQRLAAAAGHHLAVPSGGVASGAASRRGVPSSGVDVVAWLAFVVGALLVAAAWVASLRAQPLRHRDGVASSHGS